MTRYTSLVCQNILPISVGRNLPEVFQEWFFTEQIKDHGDSTEVCQLCGQENLRYHFEIQNRWNENAIWVGSSCILQFDVAVFEGDRRLTKAEATGKLASLTKRMRLESCLRALEALAASRVVVDPLFLQLPEYNESQLRTKAEMSPVIFKGSIKVNIVLCHFSESI